MLITEGHTSARKKEKCGVIYEHFQARDESKKQKSSSTRDVAKLLSRTRSHCEYPLCMLCEKGLTIASCVFRKTIIRNWSLKRV